MGELQRHRHVVLGASLIGRVIGDFVWGPSERNTLRQFRQTIFRFTVPQIAYDWKMTRTLVAPTVF